MPVPAIRRVLFGLLAMIALVPAAQAGGGAWVAGTHEGQPAAEVVTLVGEGGVSANRVSLACDRFGAITLGFARRPGLPAMVPLTLILWTDGGSLDLSGTTNRYGVLVVLGAQATRAARLLAAARGPARVTLADGGIFGPVGVTGSARAIGPILERCGPRN